MARQVLGKGLSALIQQNEVSASLTQQMNDEKRVITAKVNEIQLSPFQPRRVFNEEQTQELAKSIRERGLVQPLVVRRVEGKFELIAGERRLRAVKSLGHTEVKVVVMKATDQEVAEITLIENLQREDLTPLEEAEQYHMLQTRFGLKQEEIARHVGKSRAVIANMVRLLDLTEPVRERLNQKEISVGHAKVLLQLKNKQQQVQAADSVVRRGLTVRQTEKLVHDALEPPPPSEAPAPQLVPMDDATAEICRQLSKSLGVEVNILPKGRRSGVIEISYNGRAELTRLLEIFGITARV